MLSKAWYEGYASYEDWSECHYPEDSQESSDWEWGYSCAQTDDEGYRMANGEE